VEGTLYTSRTEVQNHNGETEHNGFMLRYFQSLLSMRTYKDTRVPLSSALCGPQVLSQNNLELYHVPYTLKLANRTVQERDFRVFLRITASCVEKRIDLVGRT
jgi:hypothetical protein